MTRVSGAGPDARVCSSRAWRLVVLATTLLVLVWAPCAQGADPVLERAIERAQQHELVQERLSLRSGDYGVEARYIDVESDLAALGYPPGRKVWVEYSQEGTWRLSVMYDPELDAIVASQGQQLLVMPETDAPMYKRIRQAAVVVPLLVASAIVLLLGAWSRWRIVFLAVPIWLLGASYVWGVSGKVDPAHLRLHSAIQYGIPIVALLLAVAGVMLRTRRPPDRVPRVRMPSWLAVGMAVAGLTLQAWLASGIHAPIDVAYASNAGATLIAGGAIVYGNVIDVPGNLAQGDTYGPVAYLVYVPGTMLFDPVRESILGTNVVLSILVALLLVATGARAGSVRAGCWAAAAWSTNPVTVYGGASGHNDVVLAALVAIVPLVAIRPGWRGGVLAAATATKFLPALLLAGQLQRGNDQPRAWRRALGSFVGVSAVIWIVGLGNLRGVREFAEGVRYQAQRDDIASFWGLAGIGPARYAMLSCAIAVFVIGVLRSRRAGEWTGLAYGFAAAALAIAGLPQYWFSYAAWLLPPMLALAIMPERIPQDVGSSGGEGTAASRGAAMAAEPTISRDSRRSSGA